MSPSIHRPELKVILAQHLRSIPLDPPQPAGAKKTAGTHKHMNPVTDSVNSAAIHEGTFPRLFPGLTSPQPFLPHAPSPDPDGSVNLP